MKKSTRKLVVRQETIRALVGVELARVTGGDAAVVPQTAEKVCTVLAAPPLARG